MKFKDVVQELEKHSWWSEEAPGTLQMIVNPMKCFIAQSRTVHPEYLSIFIVGFKDDYFFERGAEDEKYEIYKYFFKKMQKDELFLDKMIKKTEKRKKICFSEAIEFMKNKESMDDKEVYKSYSDFIEKYISFLEFPASLECVDMLTAYHIKDFVKKEADNLSEKQQRELIFILGMPRKLSFMEEERKDFLEFCISNYSNIKKDNITEKMKKELENLSKKYYYVLNNYKRAVYLDANHFYKQSKEEIQNGKDKLKKELDSLKKKIPNLIKKKKELYGKNNFSDDLRLHFKIIEIMGENIDERKKNMSKANHYIEQYCKEIGKRGKIDTKTIKDMTMEEIRDLLINRKFDKSNFDKRKKGSAVVMTKTKEGIKTNWFYGEKAEIIFKKTGASESDKIEGQTASAPVKKLKGEIQVILDISKKEFKKGSVLVTTMTRPEFVPLMRKASAIITDEGGITCHAAIISRELKIPCIIGTKNATKILKDGDLVEINTEKGIVKKLK